MINQYFFWDDPIISDSNDSSIGLFFLLIAILGLTGYWIFQVVSKDENILPAPVASTTPIVEGTLTNLKNINDGALSFLGIHK